MNKTEDYINNICSFIKNKSIHRNISEEIRGHINDLKYELSVEKNLDEIQSEELALKRMGNPSQIGKNFNKIYSNSFDILLILGMLLLVFLSIFTVINLYNDGIIYSISDKIISLIIGFILFFIIFFSDYQKILKNRHYILLLVGIVNLFIIYIFNFPSDMCRFSLLLFILGFSSMLSNFECKKIARYIFFIISVISLFLVSKAYSIILLCCLSILLIFNITKSKKGILNIIKNTTFIFISSVMLLVIVFITQNYLLEKYINSYDIDKNASLESWDISLKREIIKNSNYFNNNSVSPISLGGLDDNNVLVYLLDKYGKFIILCVIVISYIMACKQVFNISKMKDILGKNILLGLSSAFIFEFAISLFNIIGMIPDIYISVPFISASNINIIESLVSISIILAVYKKKNFSLIIDNM